MQSLIVQHQPEAVWSHSHELKACTNPPPPPPQTSTQIIMYNFCIDTGANTSSETQGQIVGPKTKIKMGGKKFDEQKYERKIRAPGDKLFTHQFQTAERIRVFVRLFGTGA